jgi:acyl-coenzyme A synthetase/AMP-(fatty) acid ligase
MIDLLTERMKTARTADAIVWNGTTYSYGHLLTTIERVEQVLETHKIGSGNVICIQADFSPVAVALLLSLIRRKTIIVPLSSVVGSKKKEYLDISSCDYEISVNSGDELSIHKIKSEKTPSLIQDLQKKYHPGLILFSSGSTGKSKAALHDFEPLLEKFKMLRKSQRTLAFLLFDHIGGVNTLLHTLSNTGCLVTVQDRTPDAVCKAIQNFKVEVLPTSPSFLNLLLVSRAYERSNLSTLRLITYGTEVMPVSTLQRLTSIFPNISFLQTYGLSELGILRSKSKSSDSLWVKIGGEGYETRVVNGALEIKAKSSMLGYLNAPSPFTSDGWFMTGDLVEVDGEYVRILGRQSEIINVGGEKVYPVEVESALQELPEIQEVTVMGEKHALLGQIVVAHVRLAPNVEISLGQLRSRIQIFLRERLAPFKIPQKIVINSESLTGARFKKIRRPVSK